MRSRIQAHGSVIPVEQLLDTLSGVPGLILLHSSLDGHPESRYSFLSAFPMVTFRSFGTDCHVHYPSSGRGHTLYGNPWRIMDRLLQPFEVLEELDSPFPLGGCFGYWGYDLKHFVEPKLERTAFRKSPLPDACVGLYPSLVVLDHLENKTWIVATGFHPDGNWAESEAVRQIDRWKGILDRAASVTARDMPYPAGSALPEWHAHPSRDYYLEGVRQAQGWIAQGDIYQVNLSRELSFTHAHTPVGAYLQLQAMSPAPFSAYMDGGEFQILGASPESFLKMDGRHVVTRPIKGTRPRGRDAQEDARLAYELQSSQKERSELLMITDLLRNDLGRVCEYGSVSTPELMRLERFPQVHHLVSTVEGTLRKEFSHLQALHHCFPGGSITGAPKFRAMEIIESLEPITRGPYTGSMGYLGFNRSSRLNITIRTAVKQGNQLSLHVGAGIVSDSDPEAEFTETEHKAAGFLAAFASETVTNKHPAPGCGNSTETQSKHS
ncbi:MAG: aminodeoxychorismate synthase component I [Verrucomicrobiota bacterium]|nr:aminodeoxychorismate synthase component I [Verrucomicrobiota bacterium]